MTTDGGATWQRVGFVAGTALAYYPERVVVTGMRGKTVQFEFSSPDGLPWQLDEISVVAHGAPVLAASDTARLLPSANPLRGDIVYFNWPFGASAGDLSAYDFAGHLAWRTHVSGGTKIITWNVHDSGIANGVYLVLARAGGRTRQFKLFVTRPR